MDEIFCEDRCSDKFNANYLKILLKIILTEIINILCYSDQLVLSRIN